MRWAQAEVWYSWAQAGQNVVVGAWTKASWHILAARLVQVTRQTGHLSAAFVYTVKHNSYINSYMYKCFFWKGNVHAIY